MGNCCGSQSSSGDDNNFQGQGRTLNAPIPANAPPQTDGARTAAAPPKVDSCGKPVGKKSTIPSLPCPVGPREAAARAAEARTLAQQAPTGGKLDRQLKIQQRQTQNQTLAQGAQDNLAAREVDAQAQARNYD